MKSSIRKCPKCGRYSLEMRCQDCDVDTVTSHPAKYSPDDRYGKYRRMSIQDEYGENGKYDDGKI